MRLIPILLLTVALAAAGCFGKSNNPTPTPATSGGGGNTPPTSGGGTTPPTSGGTPPATMTPTTGAGNNTNTTPAKPAPKKLCDVANDFSAAPGTPNPGPPPSFPPVTKDCGTVTTGYTKLDLSGNFTSSAPVEAGNGIVVNVLDSTGAVVASCAGPGTPGPAATTPCTGSGAVKAGAYTLRFDGNGAVQFAGTVMIS